MIYSFEKTLNKDEVECKEEAFRYQKTNFDSYYYKTTPLKEVAFLFLNTLSLAIPTYIYISCLEGAKQVKKFRARNDVIIRTKREDFFLAKEEIKKKALEAIVNKQKLNIVIDGTAGEENVNPDTPIEYVYTKEEIQELVEFNNELIAAGMQSNIKFNEYFRVQNPLDLKYCWDLDQVINTNNELDAVVERIKQLDLSPYETMLYIHKYITSNYQYGFNDMGFHNKTDGRKIDERNGSIISAIELKQTICVGHASLTKAIIDKLNNPNLTCTIEGVFLDECGHALNFVNVKDDKYNINGRYVNDASNDAKNEENPTGRGFAMCMYPIADLENIVDVEKVFKAKSKTRSASNGKYSKPCEWQKEKQGEPIELEKTKEALNTVYFKASEFHINTDVIAAVEEELNKSYKQANSVFKNSAKNAFIGNDETLNMNFNVKMNKYLEKLIPSITSITTEERCK